MSLSLGFIFLCIGVALASKETYRAAVFDGATLGGLDSYVSLIQEAGKLNADILVLPSPQMTTLSSPEGSEVDNYDEVVKALSRASKQARLYVVAHLLEKTRCQNKYELVRSNLVFDREGNIASVYRKPLNNIANCTATPIEIGSFSTDFGVTFGLLMEEDLVLQRAEDLKWTNFVLLGAWHSDIAFLSASHITPSWAFTNNRNLVSGSAIFAGRRGSVISSKTSVSLGDLNKFGDDYINQEGVLPVLNLSKLKGFPSEDLSHYIVRPLDVMSSVRGYEETVCHGGFCCKFYVKTKFAGRKDEEVNYGLAAFDGIRHFDRSHNIGYQACAIFACAGLYKRSCILGSQHNTDLVFERISLSGNFTESRQYPIIMTSVPQNAPMKYITTVDTKQANMQMMNLENLMTFGVFGRDFSKDTENFVSNTNSVSIYETMNEEMNELFDYVWIRFRVLLIIASIYVLEML